MGIDINGVALLIRAQECGVSFAKTATLGRQELHLFGPQLERVMRSWPSSWSDLVRGGLQSDRYADRFFQLLGSQTLTVFDASDYEGAGVVQDMNLPLPDKWKVQFSAVFDGGSLEHIFNFPVAIRNLMEMVEPGGHFLGITPANNFMGHGFYQFSPELFFRVFSTDNGYELEEVILYEDVANSAWYRVTDPDQLGRRVELANYLPTYLFVRARRRSAMTPFVAAPSQSDYARRWRETAPCVYSPDATAAASCGAKWWNGRLPTSFGKLRRLYRSVMPGRFKLSSYKRIR